MKKIISIILVTILCICAFGMPYAKKCTKCQERVKSGKSFDTSIGIMHRDFETPHKIIDSKKCTLYKCQYGCQVWIPLEDN